MSVGSGVIDGVVRRVLSVGRRRKIADFAQRFSQNQKAILGGGIVALLIIVAVFSPLILPDDAATKINPGNSFAAPSPAHPFGTDNLGRDVFNRVVLGTRISFYIGTLSVVIATVAGVPLGAIAGYVGGNTDDGIMRVMDILMSFPPILLALTVTTVLGPTLTNALIALGITYTPYFARVTRSEVVSVANEEFVEAAKSLGESEGWILSREVLPNAMAPIIVQMTISMAFAILNAAALSFLGLGAQPPQPAWGLMIQQARQFLETAPWMAAFPGLGIAVTVLGFNLLGDGLRDVLDPTLNTEMGADE